MFQINLHRKHLCSFLLNQSRPLVRCILLYLLYKTILRLLWCEELFLFHRLLYCRIRVHKPKQGSGMLSPLIEVGASWSSSLSVAVSPGYLRMPYGSLLKNYAENIRNPSFLIFILAFLSRSCSVWQHGQIHFLVSNVSSSFTYPHT